MKKLKSILVLIITITILMSTMVVPVMASDTVLGDANQSGSLELDDAQLVLRAALNIEFLQSTPAHHAADMDYDGGISLYDAQLVLKAALKIITLKRPMSEEEVHNRLVEYYKKGTDDDDNLTVMEGEFVDAVTYNAHVRCGVPGNPEASQWLYDVYVETSNGYVYEENVLTGWRTRVFNLFEKE